MNVTGIEWCDLSANPLKYRDKRTGEVVWGCVKKSPGCAHCYAEQLAKRYGRGGSFTKAEMEHLDPFMDGAELRKMLTAKTVGGVAVAGSRVFVGDMTDCFGEWVKFELLHDLFTVFASRPDVTWQVLTKRADRMAQFFYGLKCPPNVWCGVSVEDRKHGLPRIDTLRGIPAAVRFLSVEPLLEDLGPLDLTGISWVIVGGESGHGARPMHPAWARSLRDQCVAAGVAFFFKQHGEYVEWDGSQSPSPACRSEDGRTPFVRLGKKAAGRLLDGREWNEFPAAGPIAAPADKED